MAIADGKGRGYKAAVDVNNRLSVESTQRSSLQFYSIEAEEAYDFSTGGFVSITSADTETGVFYVKNTSTAKNFLMHSIRTCAESVHKIIIYKNPTGGTLISAETAASATNLNLTSSNTPSANYYKGAEGATISGGSVMTQDITNVGHSTNYFDGAFILGPDDSIGITFEVASAGDVCVRVVGHYQ